MRAIKTTHPGNIMGKNSNLPADKTSYFRQRSTRVDRVCPSFALVVSMTMSISLHSDFPVS
jgi:hypothetical protein